MVHQRQYKWLLLLLLIALFVPYLYISQYANPVADDLIYAANKKKNDLLQLLIRDYFYWNGRYASNILVFSNPMVIDSLWMYKAAPIALLIFTILSNFFFITVVLKELSDNLERMIITLLFSLLFLYQLPILSEGIYWYTGAITYQLANCLMLVYLALLRLYTTGKTIIHKFVHILLLGILLIAVIGFNEVHMIAFLMFACISLFIIKKHKLPHARLFISLFVLTMVSSAMMVFAPGNEIRAGMMSGNHRFLPSLFFSLAQTLRFFLEWISSPPLILLSVLYYYFNKKQREHNALFAASFYLSQPYSVALLFFTVFIAVFPAYWSMGMLGQHRTLNVAYCLFLLLWFINLTVFFNAYREQLDSLKPLSFRLMVPVCTVIVFSFLFTKNGYDLLNDLFYGRACLYDQQMQKRNELMREPRDTIYFDRMVNSPKSLLWYDMTESPDYWLNQSYTLYFEGNKKVMMRK
jgi:hypothetical protein